MSLVIGRRSGEAEHTDEAALAAEADLDRRGTWWSVALGTGFGVLAMLYSLYGYSWLYHKRLGGRHVWYAPQDIWEVVGAGRFVWHGALQLVYGEFITYALPLSFFLTAPASAVVEHYNLVQGIVPVYRPSAWLVIGPYSLIFGIFLLDAVRRLSWDLGLRRKLWAVQLLAVGIVLVPGFEFGHFEDVIALTFVLHAIRYLMAAEMGRAALLLSLAIATKQWAVMLVPLVVLRAPAGRRIRTLVEACALPALLLGFFLAIDFHHTFRAMFEPLNLVKNFPGHGSFFATWLGTETSRWSRSLGAVLAVGLGFAFRRVTVGPRLLACVSVVLLLRPLSEAVNYSYYWSPALLLAGLVGLAAHRRFRIRDWIGPAAAIAWTLPHGNPHATTLWWLGELLWLALTYLQVLVNCGIVPRLKYQSADADIHAMVPPSAVAVLVDHRRPSPPTEDVP